MHNGEESAAHVGSYTRFHAERTGHTEDGRIRGSSPGAAFVLLSRTARPLSRAGQAGRLGAGVSWTTPRINTDAQRLIGPFS